MKMELKEETNTERKREESDTEKGRNLQRKK
jgi:hypothetical protein